jgi:phosphoglycerol transferase MdoB-like AlkP superfamily enzyme
MIFEYRQNRYRLEPYFKSMIYLPWIIALMGAGMTWYFKSLNLFNYLGVCLILYLPLIYVYSKWKNKKHVLHLWLVLGVVLAVIKLNIVQALLHL